MSRFEPGRPRTRADIVENCPAIDVNALWREGRLASGYLGRLNWQWPDGQVASVGVATDPKQVVFSFAVVYAEERVYVSVALIWKTCYRGGQRPYLRCPTCLAMFSKLYWVGTRICCRRCGRLGYATQLLNKADRALRKLNAVRVAAGLKPFENSLGARAEVPQRLVRLPRRWRRTQQRLQQRLQDVERRERREFLKLWEKALARQER